MTTVLVRKCPTSRRMRVEGLLRWAVLVSLATGLPAAAQDPPVHWLHAGAMPPGAIGSQRLQRSRPLSGYFQPVRIRAPEGARIALAMEGGFAPAEFGETLVGLQIGAVYRLRLTNISGHEGEELFPTVELIDRLYPPPGLARRYPIPIELTRDDLELALQGMFVTRVIYVEDPLRALPVEQHHEGEQPWVEIGPGDDPLVMADGLGRPVAILRMGGRVPQSAEVTDPNFAYGSPPVQMYGRSADGM